MCQNVIRPTDKSNLSTTGFPAFRQLKIHPSKTNTRLGICISPQNQSFQSSTQQP
jgi:hypothetical protein